MIAYYNHRFDSVSGSMQCIINYIKAEEEIKEITDSTHNCIPTLVTANVRHAISLLRNNPFFAERYASKQLTIVGAVYHLHKGTVELLD